MKKSSILLLFCILLLFSGPASAALIPGSWNSDNGDIETGTWHEYIYGDWPGFIGTQVTADSDGGAWNIRDGVKKSLDYESEWIAETGGAYKDFRATYVGNVLSFTFSDLNTYTANLSTVVDYRMHYDNSGNYLGMDNIINRSWGIINENPNYSLYTESTGYETYSSPELTPPEHGGVYDYVQVDINAVPIPGAIWLLGSGLIGLVGVRRKFRK